MINGAFTVCSYDGKYLFLKRKDNNLWDLPGGGFDPNEIDYKSVAVRELKEEAGVSVSKNQLNLFAILGQKIKKVFSDQYGVENGFLFLHSLVLHEKPEINLGDEHTEYQFFSYTEILEQYKNFSSGQLWSFFTFLAFSETQQFQEGLLRERKSWLGKEYF